MGIDRISRSNDQAAHSFPLGRSWNHKCCGHTDGSNGRHEIRADAVGKVEESSLDASVDGTIWEQENIWTIKDGKSCLRAGVSNEM